MNPLMKLRQRNIFIHSQSTSKWKIFFDGTNASRFEKIGVPHFNLDPSRLDQNLIDHYPELFFFL